MSKLKALMLCSAILFVLVLLPRNAYAYSGTGVVNCTGYLNVRQSPSTSAKIVDKLYPETKVSIQESTNGWYKINYNGINGWVYGAYVSTESPAPSAAAATPVLSSRGSTDKAQKIAEFAQKYIGVRYVYGGESPSGFDCSGLTQYVYGSFGISLERRASYQVRQGTAVSKSDLQTGDLVFFDTDGGHNSISHVGIYIGNSRFIHAESGGPRRVRISSLNESYYARNYMTARRVMN